MADVCHKNTQNKSALIKGEIVVKVKSNLERMGSEFDANILVLEYCIHQESNGAEIL